MINDNEYDLKFKIMILGESMVGKTSLINRYTLDVFGGKYLCTVGIDFQKKIIEMNGKKILLQIWDTAGQERYRNINKSYFQQSNAFILAYDMTNTDSFDQISYWIKEVCEKTDDRIKSILVATKVDLEDNREVSTEDGEKLAKEHNLEFFETSAKDNINIKEAFENLVSQILSVSGTGERESIVITRDNNKVNKDKKKCC